MLDFKSLALLTTLLGTSISHVSAAKGDVKITWDGSSEVYDNSGNTVNGGSGDPGYHHEIDGENSFSWKIIDLNDEAKEDLYGIDFLAQVEKDFKGTAEFKLVSSGNVDVIDDKDGAVVLKSTSFTCFNPGGCGTDTISFDTSTQ